MGKRPGEYPPELIGKSFRDKPENICKNGKKGTLTRRTLFNRVRKSMIAKGEIDPLVKIVEAMVKKAAVGDVSAANLILENLFGKSVVKSAVKHSGNMSLVELVAGSIKKEKGEDGDSDN